MDDIITKVPSLLEMLVSFGWLETAENRWWAQQDSNLRHADYESAALPTELWARQWVKHTRYFTLLRSF
jgi:hypothetical protein